MNWNTRYAHESSCDCGPMSNEDHTAHAIRLIREKKTRGEDVSAPDAHIDFHFMRGAGEA